VKLTISVGQMAVQAGQPAHNLACMREWTAEAARRGSDLVVFPELWDSGYALDEADALASPLGGGRFAEVAALARDHHIHILGSMLEAAGNDTSHPRNTAAWFTPEGEVAGTYRKIHLFRLMDEHRHLSPGNAPLILDLPWGPTGVAICYDLRFPELFRGYGIAGAALTVIPAQWPERRIAHWQTLLRARAIENQMAVVGCNRAGSDGETRFGGRSAIIDAWGNPVVEAGDQPVLLTAELDLAEAARVRQHMPVFDDRRPDIY
jgi:omega-amidase